jgi:hypothetical protein
MWIYRTHSGKNLRFLSVFLVFWIFFSLCRFNVAAQTAPFIYDAQHFISSLTQRPTALTIADVNGDGADDFVVIQNGFRPRVYFWSRSSGNFFPDSSAEISARILTPYGPLSVLDINGDGKKDVMVAYNNNDTTAFFTWNGNTFTALKRPDAIASIDFNARSHNAFADFNRDGLLDYIVARNNPGRQPSNYIIYNVFAAAGQPSIIDWTSEIQQQNGSNYSSYVADFNNDGWPDYYRVNWGGERARIFRGTAQGLFNVFESQVNVSDFSWGAAILDYNGDGLLDIYRGTTSNPQGTNPNRFNVMFRNLGNFVFDMPDVGAAILENRNTVNAAAGDPDNDGDLDLLTADTGAPVSYYQNEGNGRFSKVNLDPIAVTSSWVFAEFVDFDEDGKLDMFSAANFNSPPFRYYRNVTTNQNKWLKIELVPTNTVFKEPFGARLALTANINGRSQTQIRDIAPYNGYNIFRSFTEHFGLGNANTPAELVIRWPSGQVQQVSVALADFNKKLKIVEPVRGKLAVLNSVNLQSATGIAVSDSIRMRNVGKGDVRLLSISSPPGSISIDPSTVQIPPGATRGIRVTYTPSDADGSTLLRTVLIGRTDGVVDSINLVIETRNLGREAPFKIAAGSGAFFTGGDFHAAGLVGYFAEPKDSMSWFSVTDVNTLRAFSGSVQGGFTGQTIPLGGNAAAIIKSAAAGDLNRDGRNDLLIARFDAAPVVLLNQTDGLQAAGAGFLPGGAGLNRFVKIADFNRDSRFEPLFIKSGLALPEFFYFTNGTFTAIGAGDLTSTAMNASAAAVHDINGDRFLDVLVADENRPSNAIRYFRNTQNGGFQEVSFPAAPQISGVFRAIHVFDVNNDGRMDVFIGSGNAATPSQIWIQQTNGSFQRLESAEIAGLPAVVSDIAGIDFNLDGFEDLLLVYNQFLVNNVLLLNRGGTGFQRLTKGEAVEHEPYSTISALIADANKDAKPDLWYLNSDFQNTLFLNEGTPGYNWVAIRPKFQYSGGEASIPPGTRVELMTVQSGRPMTQTRYTGLYSQRSTDLSAVYFGSGTATSGTVTVVFPDGTEVMESVSINGGYIDILQPFTNVSEERPTLPLKLSLYAYPNPFNPSTQLQFSIPAPAHVELSVFTVTGQRVGTLVQQRLAAGTHQIQWNAATFSSGVYLLVLKADNLREVKKITLLK